MNAKQIFNKLLESTGETGSAPIKLDVSNLHPKDVIKLKARLRYLKHAHWKKETLLPEMTLKSTELENGRILEFQLILGKYKGSYAPKPLDVKVIP